VRACLRTPADFARVAREFCADEAASGVRYAEVSFTAASHGERAGLAAAGVAASFAPPATKARLRAEIDSWLAVGRVAP
jgi:adenosine deaminase